VNSTRVANTSEFHTVAMVMLLQLNSWYCYWWKLYFSRLLQNSDSLA